MPPSLTFPAFCTRKDYNGKVCTQTESTTVNSMVISDQNWVFLVKNMLFQVKSHFFFHHIFGRFMTFWSTNYQVFAENCHF